MKKISNLVLASLVMVACQNPSSENESNTKAKDDSQAASTEETNTNQPPAVPKNAKVFFANLQDGDTLSSPFLVEFGIEGMEVEPAGAVNEGKGHHHIIINNQFIEFGGTVPSDSVNIHYGKGQTSDSLDLNPGKYSLTMQFADGYHRSYGKQLSSTIKVVVK